MSVVAISVLALLVSGVAQAAPGYAMANTVTGTNYICLQSTTECLDAPSNGKELQVDSGAVYDILNEGTSNGAYTNPTLNNKFKNAELILIQLSSDHTRIVKQDGGAYITTIGGANQDYGLYTVWGNYLVSVAASNHYGDEEILCTYNGDGKGQFVTTQYSGNCSDNDSFWKYVGAM